MDDLSPPLVLLNPAANRGKMQLYRSLLHTYMQNEAAQYLETTHIEEARQQALIAATEGRSIIIVGGDGTINEVVNALLAENIRVPLGIVPSGSGNDFARHALQIPDDPAIAIERAFHGKTIEVDAGLVNGRFFNNGFSIGLDADIALKAEKMKKIPLMFGKHLYYTSILRQLFFGYHHCPYLTFQLDQQAEHSSRRYVLIAVSNGPSYGAGFRINPQANISDGFFDICTIDHLALWRAIFLLSKVQRGEHEDIPEVQFYRSREISIHSPKPVTMQVDGETSRGMHFTARILPGALLFRV